MTTVSFVIPCYNYGRFLPDCLSSIFDQQGTHDFEVIVVDDCSSDNTAEVLAAWARPTLRVVRHIVNQGHVVTVNEGIRLAQGDFIARIDPDDRYRPGFLKAVLEKFMAYPEVGLVYGNAALINEAGQVTLDRADRVHGQKDFKGNEFIALLAENFICAPTTIARRAVWQSVPPVPQGLAFNDWYFNLMMARQFEFYYLDEVLADYRVHGTNHHTRVARDKSEEQSIFRLLDGIYSERETSPILEIEKLHAKDRIYGMQYLAMGDKYFNFEMYAEARRCYLNALGFWPRYFANFGLLRRLMGALLGTRTYNLSKAIIKAVR